MSASKSVNDDNSVDRESEQVWRPFVDGLRAFIAGRVPDRDAQDVLQDTLLRLHESASSLKNADRAEAWVFSIARHAIADYFRSNERRPDADAPRIPADVRPTVSSDGETLAGYPGRHDVHEEVLSWLRPMAESLPEMYSRPLVMADFEGYTQKEVADEIGLSLSGAKSRVQRARKKLRARLQACCRIEFGPEGRAIAFRRKDPETCQ